MISKKEIFDNAKKYNVSGINGRLCDINLRCKGDDLFICIFFTASSFVFLIKKAL